MRGIGALMNPPTKSFESGSSRCRDLLIAQPIPVATTGHRTTGRSQSPLDRGRRRSRKPVSDGWVVGREVLASFDHLMLGLRAKSNNHGATKKKFWSSDCAVAVISGTASRLERGLPIACRPDWDIATPELKAAWQQGRKELFYPYGKTFAQTLGEQS